MVVDGDEEAFEYHYSWINRGEHKWKPTYKRRKLTLKADPVLSFQPQNQQGNFCLLYTSDAAEKRIV